MRSSTPSCGETTAGTRTRRPAPPIPAELPLLLDPALVAALLSMSRRSFDRAVSTGGFPPADVRRGAKFVRWRKETVLGWIEDVSGDKQGTEGQTR